MAEAIALELERERERDAARRDTAVLDHGEMDYRKFFAITGTLSVASLVFIRVWQGAYWFPEGTDATTWEFARYWMGLLYAQFAVVGVVAMLALTAYWKPCRVCVAHRAEFGRPLPEHENQHIGRLFSTVSLAALFGTGVAYFAEQDAAWHQVVVRDSTFTPSHIPLFFFTFPLIVVFTFQSAWYAYRRLHYLFVKEGETGIPLAYLTFPIGALILTANVALNEWGHSTWITEELFVQPFHWPFAWALYFFFSVTGLLWPTLPRFFDNVKEIADRKAVETSAS